MVLQSKDISDKDKWCIFGGGMLICPTSLILGGILKNSLSLSTVSSLTITLGVIAVGSALVFYGGLSKSL